jgi:hypothetical protein
VISPAGKRTVEVRVELAPGVQPLVHAVGLLTLVEGRQQARSAAVSQDIRPSRRRARNLPAAVSNLDTHGTSLTDHCGRR